MLAGLGRSSESLYESPRRFTSLHFSQVLTNHTSTLHFSCFQAKPIVRAQMLIYRSQTHLLHPESHLRRNEHRHHPTALRFDGFAQNQKTDLAAMLKWTFRFLISNSNSLLTFCPSLPIRKTSTLTIFRKWLQNRCFLLTTVHNTVTTSLVRSNRLAGEVKLVGYLESSVEFHAGIQKTRNRFKTRPSA